MAQEGNITEEQGKAKPAPTRAVKQILVRYGKMGVFGWFEHNENSIPRTKRHVIVKTDRGLELGEVIGPYSYQGGRFRLSVEQVDRYFKQADQTYEITSGGRLVRFATPEDLCEQEHLELSAQEEARCCQKYARELGLDMKIIEAEHLFGGERIIFYFLSDGRVDFRELVKRLAREYQTRIELRQIGSRDEARLISDYESCGMECCCKRFLKILEPVNMRMAKLQKATLDPSKISGHCGRLKCCLRYEDETYRELKKNLPAKNTEVRTPKGIGRVVDGQILTQLAVVQLENGDRSAWRLDELELLDGTRLAEPPAGFNGGCQGCMGSQESSEADEETAEELEAFPERETPRRDTEPTARRTGGAEAGGPNSSNNRPRKRKNRRRNSNHGGGSSPDQNPGAGSRPVQADGESNARSGRRGGRRRGRRNRSGRPNPGGQGGSQPSSGAQ
jgi:cell fate regulator YaaT (PSP1 superfamily)